MELRRAGRIGANDGVSEMKLESGIGGDGRDGTGCTDIDRNRPRGGGSADITEAVVGGVKAGGEKEIVVGERFVLLLALVAVTGGFNERR